MTTQPVVERLLIAKLFYAVVFHGVADRSQADHAAVLRQLEAAMDDELAGLPRAKRESATRHAAKAVDVILAPYISSGESCAKFGLATFYAVRALIDAGLYALPDGPLSDAIDAVLNPEGTITEIANIDRLDASAQKQSRRLLNAIQSLGYFQELRAA